MDLEFFLGEVRPKRSNGISGVITPACFRDITPKKVVKDNETDCLIHGKIGGSGRDCPRC